MSDSTNSTIPLGGVDETPSDILNDDINLIASTTINGVAYGVVLTLFLINAYQLVTIKRSKMNNQWIFHLIYISVMFVLGTVYTASNARTIQLSYVQNRNFPGGPALYNQTIFSLPISVAGLVAFFGANWMADGLLIWRLSVVYRNSRWMFFIVLLPLLIFFASFAMSIVLIFESCKPNGSFWGPMAIKFALAYYSLTVSMTIISTGFLITRLLMLRRHLVKVLGAGANAANYTGVVAMVVESSSLYTVWAIIFLGLYIVNSPYQYVFLASLAEVQIIAPLLIMFRVTQGKAWDQTTSTTLSTFRTAGNSHTQVSKNSVKYTTTTETDADLPMHSYTGKGSGGRIDNRHYYDGSV